MDKTTNGWINGLIGVVIFAGSLPATRVAVMDLDPMFLTGARATIAALLGGILLLAFGERRPRCRTCRRWPWSPWASWWVFRC